jgi:hypothetical protein
MSFVQIPPAIPTPISAHRFARNGFPVDAALLTKAADGLNHALAYRGKEYFRSVGMMASSTLSETKWRFACRSSALTTKVSVSIIFQLPHSSGSTGSISLVLTDGGAYTSTTTIYTPTVSAKGTDSFDEMVEVVKVITGVPSGTLLYGRFDVVSARLMAASVWEVGPAPDTANGYAPSPLQTGQPILSVDRQNAAELSNGLVRLGGPHLFNFSSINDATPRTQAAATFINVIDGGSTFGASMPGWRLDARYRNTRRADSVRCVFAHYGNNSAASGVVRAFNEAGSIEHLSMAIGSTTQWRTVAFQLPRTLEKFHVLHYSGGGTTNTIACSLFVDNP